jgi:hypothetical protein
MREMMHIQPTVSLALPSLLPSLASLEATDDQQLGRELTLARLRAQVAVVRTLTDHIERFAQVADVEGLGEQVVEEMGRLGCRLVDAAAAMSVPRRPEESGVFLRCPMSVSEDLHHYVPLKRVTKADDESHADRPGAPATKEWSTMLTTTATVTTS